MEGTKELYRTGKEGWRYWGMTHSREGKMPYVFVQGWAMACSRNQHAWGIREETIRQSLGYLQETISVLAWMYLDLAQGSGSIISWNSLSSTISSEKNIENPTKAPAIVFKDEVLSFRMQYIHSIKISICNCVLTRKDA